MKKILQNLKNGRNSIEEVPVPSINDDEILVRTTTSLISLGTESMLINFSNSNIVNKVINQKDRIQDIKKKIINEGFLKTLSAVNHKMSQPIELGYSNVGVVEKIGKKITNFKLGDRVVTNKSHSEFVVSNENFTVKIPDSLSDKEASFSIIGSIALNALRIGKVSIGENCSVIGMGLVGLITAQLLKASGCNVLGVELDEHKIEVAKSLGIKCISAISDNLEKESEIFTDFFGFDSVFIATNSKNSEPLNTACLISRKKGRIILIGESEIKFNRNIFYKKELTFFISRSYGPGRYDYDFEHNNIKFPIEYVRWNANSNIKSFLNLQENKKIRVSNLITHEFDFENAQNAYELLKNKNDKKIGIILNYKKNAPIDQTIYINEIDKKNRINELNLSFIGAGNFCSKVLLPILSKTKSNLISICSKNGTNAKIIGKKFKFKKISSSATNIINEEESDTIIISTQHNTHADFLIQCLKKNKNVFMEKPLAINLEEIRSIKDTITELNNKNNMPIFTLGFNRRYSKIATEANTLLRQISGPKKIIYSINSGILDENSWIYDESLSGGRLVGEVCHFIDLIKFFISSKIDDYNIISKSTNKDDSIIITLSFADGSIAAINYLANGPQNIPKEIIEIYANKKYLKITDFKRLDGLGWSNFNSYKSLYQDKGHAQLLQNFIYSIKNNNYKKLTNLNDIIETSELTIKLKNKL